MAVSLPLTFCTLLLLTSSGRSKADATDDKVVSAMNNFGIKLYKELIKDKDNLFCSGFSLSVALNVVLAGARTDTADEITDVLGYNDIGLSQTDIVNSIHKILTQQRSEHSGYELDIANSVWIHKNFHILPEYKSVLGEKFYAEEGEVTFGTSEATNKINSWVSEATKGNIPKLFDEPLDALVRLVLINAMYFNGTWAAKFNKDRTQSHPFNVNGGSTKDIKMMRIDRKFRYTDSDELNAQVLAMPYEGDEVSMYVVLPRENNGLEDLQRDLTFDKLIRAFDNMKEALVHVKFPKFKISSDLPLIGVLQNMGIRKAFSERVADLSGIDGTHELYISKALQKAVVEVNEEGTIASVATGVGASIRTIQRPDEYNFTADHPFIYCIRHNPTGLLLFMGRLVEP